GAPGGNDMLDRLKDRLTYANVTATVALFVALGGTSYAALKLPRNSVGSAQIRTGAVHSSEARDRSLRLRDIAVSARTALAGRPARGRDRSVTVVGPRSIVAGLGARRTLSLLPQQKARPALATPIPPTLVAQSSSAFALAAVCARTQRVHSTCLDLLD